MLYSIYTPESSGISLGWEWRDWGFVIFLTSFGPEKMSTGDDRRKTRREFWYYPSLRKPNEGISLNIFTATDNFFLFRQDITYLDLWGVKVFCGWVWKSDETHYRPTSWKEITTPPSTENQHPSKTPPCGLAYLCGLLNCAFAISWNKLVIWLQSWETFPGPWEVGMEIYDLNLEAPEFFWIWVFNCNLII